MLQLCDNYMYNFITTLLLLYYNFATTILHLCYYYITSMLLLYYNFFSTYSTGQPGAWYVGILSRGFKNEINLYCDKPLKRQTS